MGKCRNCGHIRDDHMCAEGGLVLVCTGADDCECEHYSAPSPIVYAQGEEEPDISF